MKVYSTRQAAKQLGISFPALNRYIGDKKIPVPPVTEIAGMRGRLWSEQDIEAVRKTLPKIANGRKTRYQKLREKQKEKTQPGAPPPQSRQKRPGLGTPAAVPHKSRKAKKKQKK